MKQNKIVFRFTTLLNPNLQCFKDMQLHFLNFEKKNIDMAQNSSQIIGIAFSELKAEKKQLVTEKLGKMLVCQNFNR